MATLLVAEAEAVTSYRARRCVQVIYHHVPTVLSFGSYFLGKYGEFLRKNSESGVNYLLYSLNILLGRLNKLYIALSSHL